jgi:ABC-2 type transport system ATP-binding protein
LLFVRGLEKSFGKGLFGRGGFQALAGVDLNVERGSVFGLLGPNGAGKTTLIKVLLGLIRGWKGEAKLFGMHPRDPASRRRVGYLPEAHRLPGYLSGMQVAVLSAMYHGVAAPEARERAKKLLGEVGLSKFAHKRVRTYSKGMQQRLGLAQALVHEPELVILDEPTDGVDPVGRQKIRLMVQELRQRGATVFVNSHLLSEVEQVCDRVVIMDRGKILREGTIAELTPDTGLVRFELGAPPEHMLRLIESVGTRHVFTEAGFEAMLDVEQTNELIDRIRQGGVQILAVEPQRLTLEDSFIDLVRAIRPEGEA